jgi:hypothetical protein
MASKKSPARAKKKSASSKAPKAAKAKSPKARKASVSLPPRVQSSATPLTSSELLADLPRLTDAERAAFRAQFTDEQCAALGDRTKSGAVQKDAFGWAKVMHSTLRAHPHAVRRYGATRLAWFVECLRGLETAIEEQSVARDEASASGLGVDLARTAALAVRNDLRDTLTILAGADTHEKESVTRALEAHDGASEDAALAKSLRALAELAEKWLGRHDEGARALVASVSLSRADVDAARTAADELFHASAADAGHRHDTQHDAPSTNVAEGRLLEEMRLAMHVFARAHDTNRAVPKLVPGSGTKNVLATHHGKGSAAADKGANAGDEGAAAATGGAHA